MEGISGIGGIGGNYDGEPLGSSRPIDKARQIYREAKENYQQTGKWNFDQLIELHEELLLATIDKFSSREQKNIRDALNTLSSLISLTDTADDIQDKLNELKGKEDSPEYAYLQNELRDVEGQLEIKQQEFHSKMEKLM